MHADARQSTLGGLTLHTRADPTDTAAAPRAPRLQSLAGALFVATLYSLAAFYVAIMSREGTQLSVIWLGGALLAGMLFGRGTFCRVAALSMALAGHILVEVIIGDPVGMAVLVAAASVIEAALLLLGLERGFRNHTPLSRISDLGVLTGLGLVVPLVPALAAAVGMAGLDQAPVVTAFAAWYIPHAVAVPIFTPLVLAVRGLGEEARAGAGLRQWAPVLLALAVLLPTVFVQSTYPLLFLAVPVVVLAAFLTGRSGTAVVVGLIAMVSSYATITGHGPIALVPGESNGRVLTFIAFLAVNVAIGLPVAIAIAHRASIRAELADSRDFVTAVVDGVDEVIFRTDRAWRWLYLNKRWQILTGEDPVAAVGQRAFARFVESDPEALARFLRDAETAEGQQRHLIKMRGARGAVRDIEISVTPQRDASGAFAGCIGRLLDVSRAHQREHALIQSEARFRRLAEAAPVGIYQADAQGQVVYVNSAWLRRFGLTEEEMLGDGWKTALVNAREFEEDPAFSVVGSDEQARRRVFQMRDREGDPFWCEAVTSAEYDSQGRLAGYVGIAHDITDIKTAQEQLARSRERLALLADNATDAVVRLALDGTCTYASPSSADVFGLDPRHLVGHQFITRFHPEDDASVRGEFARLVKGTIDKTRLTFRSENLHRPGHYNWLDANCGLVRDPATRQPKEIIAALRNVNATKALESDLIAARDEARNAAMAKSVFLANMSHEIRTPMNGVIGFTELALTRDLPEDLRTELATIAESGRVMMRLLNDLLDLARIEAGQMPIHRESVDLRHKLANAIRLMQPVARQKGLSLTLDIADDVPRWLQLDANRLRQIVLNLVGNALKFTERGGVTVHGAVARDEGNGAAPMLLISVADTGIGIPADRLSAIFDSFAQADPTIARRYGGTGLGLAISQQLAGLLGGSLGASSALGEGTCMTLRLPLIEAAPILTTGGDPDEGADLSISAHGLRVLVAEDNPINQRLVKAMLAKLDCDVVLTGDGEAAVAAVRENAAGHEVPFAFVLMDMQMPGMDGLEATRALRAAGFDAATLPIVALTANAYSEDIAECRKAGMQDHLSKPVRLRDLAELIERFAPEAATAGQRHTAEARTQPA